MTERSVNVPVAWANCPAGTDHVVSVHLTEQAAINGRPSFDYDTVPLYTAAPHEQNAPHQWTSEMAHAGYMVYQHPDIQCAECGAIYAAMEAERVK